MRCGFADGERVNQEMGPWLKIAGKCRGQVGWPLKINVLILCRPPHKYACGLRTHIGR